MTSYIPAEVRRFVIQRADSRCEYCLIHEDDTFCGCQIDHVIAEKHGGETREANLAFTCTFCNRFKGSDIGSIANSTGEFTRFYNPRIDVWDEHFRLDDCEVIPLTPIGEATCKILQINSADRIEERRAIEDAKNAE